MNWALVISKLSITAKLKQTLNLIMNRLSTAGLFGFSSVTSFASYMQDIPMLMMLQSKMNAQLGK
jgi:hypothetical protein